MDCYQNLFRLDDKVAIVTGAAGILGTEFSKALCILGAKVACFDNNVENLQSLKNQLLKDHEEKNFIFLTCDVSNSDSVNKAVNQTIHHFGQIDILLNNAATKTNNARSFFTHFSDYSLEVWREVMSVNLDGMFLMSQAVGKHMVSRKTGSIVQTASIYSLIAPDQRIYEGSHYLGGEINTPAVYTTSKAGVIGLTRHLAAFWGAHNIRVNALCPGGVSSGQNNIFQEKYSARVPMGRMAKEVDIVGPMMFLASDASQYMTGQILYVDGGFSSW